MRIINVKVDVSKLQVAIFQPCQNFSAAKILHLESKPTGTSMGVDGSLALGNRSLLLCHCLRRCFNTLALVAFNDLSNPFWYPEIKPICSMSGTYTYIWLKLRQM